MTDSMTEKCIIINRNNIDIIGNALEEYWSLSYHDAHTINEINDARIRIKQIKEQMKKINEIKICWS